MNNEFYKNKKCKKCVNACTTKEKVVSAESYGEDNCPSFKRRKPPLDKVMIWVVLGMCFIMCLSSLVLSISTHNKVYDWVETMIEVYDNFEGRLEYLEE